MRRRRRRLGIAMLAGLACSTAFIPAYAQAPDGTAVRPPSAVAEAVLIDAFVARVGARVITAGEVILETHVGMVVRFGADAAKTPITGELFATATESVVVQALADDAARARGFITTEESVAKAIARFELRFSGPSAYQAFLREHDAVDEEVRRVIRRNLRVDALVRALAEEADAEMGAAERFERTIAMERQRTGVRIRPDLDALGARFGPMSPATPATNRDGADDSSTDVDTPVAPKDAITPGPDSP